MKDETIGKAARYAGAGIILFVVVWSFYMIGSPGLNRELGIDKLRIQQAFDTRDAVDEYYKIKKKLPASLDALLKEAAQHSGKYDNHDGKNYRFYNALRDLLKASNNEFFNIEYKPDGESAYSICTTFFHPWGARDCCRNNWETNINEKWKHQAGRRCFDFEASAEE